jgi:DNA-directed RNA polymerase subunit RPC12/RpoP
MTSPSADGDDSGSAAAEPQPLVCARCGTRAEGPQPTWTFSVENGVPQYFCDACSRENLRAIEGRLDSDWW